MSDSDSFNWGDAAGVSAVGGAIGAAAGASASGAGLSSATVLAGTLGGIAGAGIGAAGAGGWIVGSAIYDAFDTEIASGVDWLMQ